MLNYQRVYDILYLIVSPLCPYVWSLTPKLNETAFNPIKSSLNAMKSPFNPIKLKPSKKL